MKKARWPFPSESIPWEVWNLSMEIVSLASESGKSTYISIYEELLKDFFV